MISTRSLVARGRISISLLTCPSYTSTTKKLGCTPLPPLPARWLSLVSTVLLFCLRVLGFFVVVVVVVVGGRCEGDLLGGSEPGSA